jgi:hypothetical protein
MMRVEMMSVAFFGSAPPAPGNDRRNEKIPRGDFTANRGNIIESAKRYPVVKRQKQYVKCLQSDESRFQHGNGLTNEKKISHGRVVL